MHIWITVYAKKWFWESMILDIVWAVSFGMTPPVSREGRRRVLVKVSFGHYEAINSERKFYSVLGAKNISLCDCFYETVTIGEYIVPVKMFTKKDGTQYLETYWDDENHGLRVIGNYVCDLFRQDLLSVRIVKDHIGIFYNSSYTFDNLALERADGTKASFQTMWNEKGILFAFVVWPDANGRNFDSLD
uniref:FBA_2 domain-containing protein n=1 Tax=Caenorhabditis tropicalis TaxID=1561998 RepID=A0A1I7SZD0_9PELO